MFNKRLIRVYGTSSLFLLYLSNLPVYAANVAAQSCSGIGNPLDKNTLYNRASKENKNNFEYKFEGFSLKSLNVPRNKNPERKFKSGARAMKTDGEHKYVIPDAITFAAVPHTKGKTKGKIDIYPDSVFFDARAKQGTINLSSDDYQPLGYIDYLANSSPAGLAAINLTNPLLRPTPALIYPTVADTIIGNSLIQDATKEGVALFQHVVCNNSKGTIGIDDLIMGKGIILNPSVFTGRSPLTLNPLPPGKVGTLSTPPLNLSLVFDTTGSMDDDLEQVKNSALEIVSELFDEIPNSKVSVVDYRDFPSLGSSTDYPYNALLPFSDNITDITNAINALSIGDGGDWPESAYSALVNTLQGQNIGAWQEEAEKAIILFTDAPPHDPEPFTGYTLNSVLAAAENPVTIQNNPLNALTSNPSISANSTDKPVSIYSVVIGNDSETLDYLSELSEKTGGKVYQSTDIVESFFDVISDIEKDISNPFPPSESVPEPTSVFGLLMLGLGRVLQSLQQSHKR